MYNILMYFSTFIFVFVPDNLRWNSIKCMILPISASSCNYSVSYFSVYLDHMVFSFCFMLLLQKVQLLLKQKVTQGKKKEIVPFNILIRYYVLRLCHLSHKFCSSTLFLSPRQILLQFIWKANKMSYRKYLLDIKHPRVITSPHKVLPHMNEIGVKFWMDLTLIKSKTGLYNTYKLQTNI